MFILKEIDQISVYESFKSFNKHVIDYETPKTFWSTRIALFTIKLSLILVKPRLLAIKALKQWSFIANASTNYWFPKTMRKLGYILQ